MKTIFKSTVVLVAITLIAGLALATVYEVTKEPIASAEKTARENAYRMVLPDALSFIATGIPEQSLYPVEVENSVRINACLVGVAHEDPMSALSMSAVNPIVGYVVNVTSPNGYGGDITLAVGILTDGSVSGVSVISQSETAGLGAKCADKAFTDQFVGIMGPVEYVKGVKSEPNQIDAISGATVTTRAVTEAVNAAQAHVQERILTEEGD